MVRRRLLALVAVLFVAFAATESVAQSGGEEPAAKADEQSKLRELVGEAQTAFEQGNFQKAVDSLLAAHRIESNPRLLFNVARSYEELDDCKRAMVYYRSFINEPSAEDALVKKAKGRLARGGCPDYGPNLAGRLVVEAEPEGVLISVDGNEKGEAPLEIAGLPSGEHIIEASKDGYESSSTRIELEPAEDESMSFELRQQETSDLKSVDTSATASGDDGGAGMSIPAIGVAGAGVVLLGIGAYIDLGVLPRITDERNAETDPGRRQDLTEKRARQANLALGCYIGGGVLAAAGATWFILDMTYRSEEKQAVYFHAAPRPDGAAAGVTFRF